MGNLLLRKYRQSMWSAYASLCITTMRETTIYDFLKTWNNNWIYSTALFVPINQSWKRRSFENIDDLDSLSGRRSKTRAIHRTVNVYLCVFVLEKGSNQILLSVTAYDFENESKKSSHSINIEEFGHKSCILWIKFNEK